MSISFPQVGRWNAGWVLFLLWVQYSCLSDVPLCQNWTYTIIISINQDPSQFLMNWDLLDTKGFVSEAHSRQSCWKQMGDTVSKALQRIWEGSRWGTKTCLLIFHHKPVGQHFQFPRGSMVPPLCSLMASEVTPSSSSFPIAIVYQTKSSGSPLVYEGCSLSLVTDALN